MASIQLKRGKWHLVYADGKRRVWRALHTSDVHVAQEMLKQFHRRLDDADVERGHRPKAITLSAFVAGPYQDYAVRKAESTRSSDVYRRKRFLGAYGDRMIASIQAADIERYRASRRETVTAATVNREMGLIRSIFARSVEFGYLDRSPCKGMKDYAVQERPVTWLTMPEVRSVVEAASPAVRIFVALAALAGLRAGEMFRLRWADVDLARGVLTVAQSKNYAIRSIPIVDSLRAVLEAAGRPTGRDLVLAHVDGRAYRDLRTGLADALTRAGITRHVRPHDLRHSFASNLIMAGVDIRTVSALLGHRSITTTMRYSHLSQDHLAESIARLDAIEGSVSNAGKKNSATATDGDVSARVKKTGRAGS